MRRVSAVWSWSRTQRGGGAVVELLELLTQGGTDNPVCVRRALTLDLNRQDCLFQIAQAGGLDQVEPTALHPSPFIIPVSSFKLPLTSFTTILSSVRLRHGLHRDAIRVFLPNSRRNPFTKHEPRIRDGNDYNRKANRISDSFVALIGEALKPPSPGEPQRFRSRQGHH